MNNLKRQLGQSLMETIVAIAILIMVVIAILGLTLASVSGQKENEQQVIANNLAREGIELVRNTRDSNWLNQSKTWDAGIERSAFGIMDVKDTFIDYDIPLFSELYLDDKGYYLHDPAGSSTPFKRLIKTQLICLAPLSEEEIRDVGENCLDGEIKVGIKVTSIITWIDNQSRAREVLFEDLLYDWK